MLRRRFDRLPFANFRERGHGIAIFDLQLSGSASVLWSPYEHGQCMVADPWNVPGCLDVHTEAWTGSIEVQTTSLADGTYSGASLLSFSFTSNLVNYPNDGIIVAWPNGPSVTLSGGSVFSVVLHGDGMDTSFDMSGLNATLRESPHQGDNIISATATLTPVPEPEIAAMMIVGMGLMALARRLTRRDGSMEG